MEQKNSVLVVDDSKLNRKILRDILEEEYTVYTAPDGPNALDITRQHLPDLIMLDVVMPEMDGFEVLASLKKSEETKNIPVLFITGLNKAEDEMKALAAGAVDYINKPFNNVVVKLRVRHQIKIVNQLRIIERLSLVDTLTNLPNRLSFNNRLSWEWQRAAREQRPVSILLLDLDKFKNYNDTYGHLAGDAVLRETAQRFRRELKRGDDFIARWGGEEFVALLANTGKEGAFIVAENLRAAIEGDPFPLSDGRMVKVTVSVGTNTQIPTSHSLSEKFIDQADKALYTAKNTGRNKVCQHDG
ncbi:MAG: diguanylate cyclase [Sporomusaceae bacterium]|jgi:diguanylate cyclase (GGDEF)-like protein|nr:diguanylate cyclase [Sporomusaceae bacterium]